MSLNNLKLNKDKTELLYLYSKHCPIKSLPPVRFGTETIIQPSVSASNIGAIFGSTMSMLPHVNSVCKSAFYHLRTISRKYHHITPVLSNPNSLLANERIKFKTLLLTFKHTPTRTHLHSRFGNSLFTAQNSLVI